jgi:hypothetical protein
MDAISSALRGMDRAEQRVGEAAAQLARMSVPGADVDPVNAMVTLATAPTEMAASAKVARTVSETLGRLVDTFA